MSITRSKTEVLEMSYELGEMATGDHEVDTARRMRYFDCSAEDAEACYSNRSENVAALAAEAGVTVDETSTAFQFGQVGRNRLR